MAFNADEDEHILVEDGPQIDRARCFFGTHATVRFTKQTVVTIGFLCEACFDFAMSKWRKTLWPSMQMRTKTFSWRTVLKLTAARCFIGTHARVRFTKEAVVTSGFPREACLDLGDVKVVKKGGPQIERGTVFLRDTCQREIHQRNIC